MHNSFLSAKRVKDIDDFDVLKKLYLLQNAVQTCGSSNNKKNKCCIRAKTTSLTENFRGDNSLLVYTFKENIALRRVQMSVLF